VCPSLAFGRVLRAEDRRIPPARRGARVWTGGRPCPRR